MADEQRHTLELIASHLIKAAQPLIDAGGVARRVRAADVAHRLLRRRRSRRPTHALATAVGDAVTATRIAAAVALASGSAGLLDEGESGLRRDSATGIDAGAERAPMPRPTPQEIGERLFELLLTDYLAAEQPGAYNVLSMLHVISVESIAGHARRGPSHVRTHFRWDELPQGRQRSEGTARTRLRLGRVPTSTIDCCSSTWPRSASRSACRSRSRRATATRSPGYLG